MRLRAGRINLIWLNDETKTIQFGNYSLFIGIEGRPYFSFLN